MGLDFVDIVFRVEKAFDVSLSEDDFDALVSDRDILVGDLYDFILKKLHLHDVGRYDFGLNHALWMEMQSVLHRVAQAPPGGVELKTPLATLFPRKIRRKAWEALRAACPFRVRKLDYPKVVRTIGFLLAATVVLIEQFQIWQLPAVNWLWPLLGLLGLWMLAETYLKVLSVLAPLRTRFPSGITTVKDLCRAVLATNYVDICRDVELPQDERSLKVWQQLTQILVDVLGVDADQITFRSRLVRDLAMT